MTGWHEAGRRLASLSQGSQARDGGRRCQVSREERNQSHGHEQRGDDRQEDGDRQHLERAPHHGAVGGECNRQEHDGGRGGGREDGPHRAPDPFGGGRIRCDAAFQLMLYRLVHDDAVVHEHADAHGEPEERDEVEAQPADEQEGEGGEEAHRHGDRDHTDGSRMAYEEEEYGESDEEAAEPQLLQAVDLLFDQLGGVEADDELDAEAPELLPQLDEALSQFTAQIDEVRPLLLKNNEAYRGLAVDAEQHLLPAGPVLYLGHVADEHGAVRDDSHLAEGLDAARTAVEYDRGASRFVLGAAQEAEAPYRAGERRRDRRGRDPQSGTAVGVDAHRDLGRSTAAHAHTADARNSGQARLDAFVDQAAQGIPVLATGHFDDHDEATQGSEVLSADVDRGALWLAARQLGRQPLHLELSDLDVGAGCESDAEGASRPANLTPRLLHAG